MSTTHPLAGTNLAILIGTLSRPPEARPLPSGDEVLSLELSVRADGQPAESVPVTCVNASATVQALDAGDEVLVVGRVRRRFFRAGGTTQSRTEVVASHVVPANRAATVTRTVAAAVSSLAG